MSLNYSSSEGKKKRGAKRDYLEMGTADEQNPGLEGRGPQCVKKKWLKKKRFLGWFLGRGNCRKKNSSWGGGRIRLLRGRTPLDQKHEGFWKERASSEGALYPGKRGRPLLGIVSLEEVRWRRRFLCFEEEEVDETPRASRIRGGGGI